ncbi:hypothetical protein C0992_007380 [Termitomyces sp. T32_za158]|nr:hypothetical protein C0992_007380 [Termitomyces sp. T32_za158]
MGKKIKKRDLFGEEIEAHGNLLSKIKSPKKDTKASYDVGNNRPEMLTVLYVARGPQTHCLSSCSDWQTMTGGHEKSAIHNPAAGKGKKTKKHNFLELDINLD